MADLEQSTINKKINEFKSEKNNLILEIERLIEKIHTYSFLGSNKDNLSNKLNKVKGLIIASFVHYDEIGFLKVLRDDVKNLNELSVTLNISGNVNIFNEKIDKVQGVIERYSSIKENFKELSINTLTYAIQEVNTELSSFRRLRNIADNAKTEDIYNNAVDKYKKLEEKYRKNFYWTIFIVASLSIGLLLGKVFLAKFLGLSIYEFWALKISVILIGIVLITYFLKQSSHYQYLADQNYQTQIELQAFPTFMESIPTEEAASVRKELALKYFGRDIDSTPHKDMANLISGQMKNTTEMVKAATDVLKVKGKE